MVRPRYQYNGGNRSPFSGLGRQGRSSQQESIGLILVTAIISLFAFIAIIWFSFFASPATKFDPEEAEALTKFIVRSLGDALPELPAAAIASEGPIYIFGFSESDSNVHSVASGVSRAYSDLITAGYPSSSVKILLFEVLNDGSARDTLETRVPNYSGSKKFLRLIREGTMRSSTGRSQHFMNLPHPPTYPDDIELHPWKHSTIHTLREAKAAVTVAKAAKASALVIVATPFHLPRCLLTTLSVAAQYDKHLKIYAHSGTPLLWDETVAHGSSFVGDRETSLDSEMERMFVYHRKGDLMRPSEALEALRKRDRRVAALHDQFTGGSA